MSDSLICSSSASGTVPTVEIEPGISYTDSFSVPIPDGDPDTIVSPYVASVSESAEPLSVVVNKSVVAPNSSL